MKKRERMEKTEATKVKETQKPYYRLFSCGFVSVEKKKNSNTMIRLTILGPELMNLKTPEVTPTKRRNLKVN